MRLVAERLSAFLRTLHDAALPFVDLHAPANTLESLAALEFHRQGREIAETAGA